MREPTMKKYKIGFRNRSALEQINICERAIANLAKTPEEHRFNVALPEVSATIAAARASHDRVQVLKSELRTETTRRKELLRVARQRVSQTCALVASNVAFEPQKMLAAGLELEAPKLPIGKPAAPGDLRAEPHDQDGAVRLRFERPVRRCTFEIEFRADSTNETEWNRYDPCLRQSCVVKGLASGVKYWFRVRALNAHGAGPWSNLASARVR